MAHFGWLSKILFSIHIIFQFSYLASCLYDDTQLHSLCYSSLLSLKHKTLGSFWESVGLYQLNISVRIVTCTNLEPWIMQASTGCLIMKESSHVDLKGWRVIARVQLCPVVLTGESGRHSPSGCDAYGDTLLMFQGNTASYLTPRPADAQLS